VPVQVEPPELARVLDFAERPRSHDWSFRAALVRYAQPQPERVSALLDLVRRLEFAVKPRLKEIERDGPALWDAATGDGTGDPFLVGALQAMIELDRLGDALAEWAVDRSGDRPDAQVDAVTADVAARLEAAGIPQAERQRPPRGARSRG